MIERKLHLDSLAIGSVVVCCFLWGLNQVAAKAAMPEIPALWQATARSTGGAALVWLWSRHRRVALFEHDGTLPGGLLAGLLFAAEFFCIFIGLQFTSASRMVVFIYIAPFVVALGMPLIARSERLRPLQIGGCWSLSPESRGRSRKASRALRSARNNGSATPWVCSPACSGALRRWPCAARR